MKLFLSLFSVIAVAFSQTMVDWNSQIRNRPLLYGASLPGSCTVNGYLFVLTSSTQLYICSAGTYVIAGGAATPPAGATTQLQYNSSGAFGASSNLTWDNTNAILLDAGTGSTSGMIAQVFSSRADLAGSPSTVAAFQTSTGTMKVFGDGHGQMLALNLGTTTGITTGSTTGSPGPYGLSGAGVLTVASCTGCGGSGSPGGATSQIQYNSSGAFAGSANLTWDNTNAILHLSGVNSSSGVIAPLLNCAATGSSNCVQQGTGTFYITGAGNASFQTVTASTTFNSLATGTTSAFQQQSGTFTILGNGTANFQGIYGLSIKTGTNNGTSALTGNGADISKTGSAVGIQEWDTGGGCSIGTGATSPGILCSSDARLKTPLTPLRSGLSEIMRLNPGTFHWLGSKEPGVGFIAQSVREVLPNLVVENSGQEHYLMLSETGMIPYLVKAVQELQAEVEELRRGPVNRTNAVLAQH